MRDESTTRTIPLTLGTGHEVALVDERDYDFLSRFTWFVTHHGYAYRWVRYQNRKKAQLAMHRTIMLPDPGMDVDHVNGNRLDNRRANLRNCVHRDNLKNRVSGSNNASGYKGCSWHKSRGKWRAVICVHGKQRLLGHFTDLVSAARAYDAAAVESFGEFAHPNFPADPVASSVASAPASHPQRRPAGPHRHA